jgi:DNA-binding GntR family transcriptional regulator
LLAESAKEQWAQPGCSTRYAILADLIEQEIADGRWRLGQRMPSFDYLAEIYDEKPSTAFRAFR